MEGEHTPTIIQLILSTDLAVIHFKDSHIFFIFPTHVSFVVIKADTPWHYGDDGVDFVVCVIKHSFNPGF